MKLLQGSLTFCLILTNILCHKKKDVDLDKVAKWANNIYVLKQHDKLR
jgi:hypothetical protein